MTEKKLSDKEEYLKLIRSSYEKRTAYTLDEIITHKYDVVPAPNIDIGRALGTYGLPRGRVVEIIGPESQGKTTLCNAIIAAEHKRDPESLIHYFDMEHSYDPPWAEKSGVNLSSLIISQPEYAEQCLNIIQTAISSGKISIIVLDSVASLVPKSELTGDASSSSSIGIMARLMSQAMRKIVGTAYRNNVLVIFVNQIREKIGVMFGSPETTPGGRALKFYSSVRIDVRSGGSKEIKDGVPIGGYSKFKVIKNKCAPPFGECQFYIDYSNGFDPLPTLIDSAVDLNIIKKSGAWYSFEGEKLGQGKQKTVDFLKSNPKLLNYLDALTRSAAGYPDIEIPEEPGSLLIEENDISNKEKSYDDSDEKEFPQEDFE